MRLPKEKFWGIHITAIDWQPNPRKNGFIRQNKGGNSMKHHENFFKDNGNRQIYYQYWLPDGDVRAVLLVVHGFAEHSGRYINLVNRFVPKGYAVYAADHQGHGRSEGVRAYLGQFDEYNDALLQFQKMAQSTQQGKPLFLIGHSMGGLIGALHLLSQQDEFRGAILSGPGVKAPGDISEATIFVGKIISTVWPRLGMIKLEEDAVSRDPAVLKAYKEDPLVFHGKITARLGAEMLKAMGKIEAEAKKIKLPILILQGNADRLVEPSGAQMLYDKVSSADKNVIFYEGLYHEVFNEPEQEKVLDDVQKWLEAHV
jgi:acylglycerol lipase